MKLKYEHINYNEGATIKAARYRNERFEVPWHYHPEYELALIVDGKGKKFIGNSVIVFEPGELVLIGGGLPHLNVSEENEEGESTGAAEVIVVQFPYEIFGQHILNLPEFVNIKTLHEKAQRGVRVVGQLRKKLQPKIDALVNLR
ncbi:MAG: cupin domain-containing protein, partial [Melioribacteraceae bacterium]|nr:cupin domain-containing protein [Melioribacteraceae bacterium]